MFACFPSETLLCGLIIATAGRNWEYIADTFLFLTMAEHPNLQWMLIKMPGPRNSDLLGLL